MMKRREFMKLTTVPAAAALPALVAFAAEPAKQQARPAIELRNGQFQLTLMPANGLRCRLVHVPSGAVLAEGNYSYSFGQPVFNDVRQTAGSVLLSGMLDNGLKIEQRFTANDAGWIEEEITLINTRDTAFDLHAARCGFALPVPMSNGQLDAKWQQHKFTAVPFLREPNGPNQQYAEYSLQQIFTEPFRTGLWAPVLFVDPVSETADYAAEGWIWSHGEQSFLITKYAQSGMEWAILDRVPQAQEGFNLRWGGLGIYRTHPEHGAWLFPGQSHRFGVTRVTSVMGPVKDNRNQGFYAFRAEMAERGHGCPADFNPPVHWNELYDNKLYWLPNGAGDDPELRKQYFSLADMKQEAAKAKAMGCEALYLDPGWDTNFGSKIWDEARLGTFKSFTAMLKNEYGLQCSLHTPLSGWCNPSSYSPETYRMDRFGNRVKQQWADFKPLEAMGSPICGASVQYIEETAKRLKVLARDGAVFFLFDGTPYHGECWDKRHGHAVPGRMHEHVAATLHLARMVHEDYPDVLIEMHDPIQPFFSRYSPIYYGHGRCDAAGQNCQARSFDSVWAFELMLDQLNALLSGKAISLYYYNLAYSLPLYLHIDLRTDNSNALAFWWNASTCRHFGMGGTHADPAVVQAHHQAMKTYMRLKPYFCRGAFYGIDEMTHVHAHPDGRSAVLNCFNLSDKPIQREVRFEPAQFNLASKSYRFIGAGFKRSGSSYVGTVNIPAQGHALIEVQ